MKKPIAIMLCAMFALTSCNNYTKLLQSADYEYKYEVAKQYYCDGKYSKATFLLQDVISPLKGTDLGEESVFLLGMSAYKGHDFESASNFFSKYSQTYPRGTYAEAAKFYSGLALYYSTPEPKLDQSETVSAMGQFQQFLDQYPGSQYAGRAQELLFKLQDKLVEKEYLSAKLYYNMGSYFGNCSFGGSNYQACIVTSENALQTYPYSNRREDFSILVLRAKFELAHQSVEVKKQDRLSDTIDEYYGFTSEYPNSKYTKEAHDIFEKASHELSKYTGKHGEAANS